MYASQIIEEDSAFHPSDQIELVEDKSDMEQSKPSVTKTDPEIQAFASHQNNEEGENKAEIHSRLCIGLHRH